jgi:hypothetical protein
MDWKYLLGLELDDPGFDSTVLGDFRARLIKHGLEEKVLEVILDRCAECGLLRAGIPARCAWDTRRPGGSPLRRAETGHAQILDVHGLREPGPAVPGRLILQHARQILLQPLELAGGRPTTQTAKLQ